MPVLSAEALVARVRNHQADLRKAASDDGSGEKDTRDRGCVTAPIMDGDKPALTGLPNSSKPDNSMGTPDGVTSETKPGGTGENQPPVNSTVKPDEVPLDKMAQVAARAKAIAEGLKNAFAKTAAPATAGAAPAAAAPKSAATATADDVTISEEFHLKIAAGLMATEQGRTLVRDYFIEQAGLEAANALVKSASDMQDRFNAMQTRQAELQKQANTAIAADQAAIDEMLKGASEKDRALIVKIANAHRANLEEIKNPIGEAFYKQGAMDAAAMQEAAGPAAGADPAAAPPGLPGAEQGPASLEQIAALLQMMVQSGELDPQTAEQVMAELAGGAGGAGAEGGAPPGAGGGEMPPGMGGAPGAAGAEAPPPEAEKSPEEEEKQANALIAELTGLKKAA